MPESIIIAWSGGKDSALALHAIRRSSAFQVTALVTTFHHGRERNAMHGIHRDILQAQAKALGLPLAEIWLNEGASNAEYEQGWAEALQPFQAQGIRRVVYGDLFLADIKAYRDQFMTRLGMEAVYPLWYRDTKKLALEFIEQGFRAKLVCVDPKQIDETFAGREFDAELLWDLPETADPCGEKGEFHTLVYASPDFADTATRMLEPLASSPLTPALSPLRGEGEHLPRDIASDEGLAGASEVGNSQNDVPERFIARRMSRGIRTLAIKETERYKRNGFAYVDYQLAAAGVC